VPLPAQVGAPPGVTFGLIFLLAFVFGSIPAAIGAGALYGVSLADADWLRALPPDEHHTSLGPVWSSLGE